MFIKNLLLFTVVALLATQISASCLCNNQGTDACKCLRNIVRPLPLPRYGSQPKTICTTIPGAQTFQPIGDLCSCSSSLVKPATVPSTCHKCGHTRLPKLPSKSNCFDTVLSPEQSQSSGDVYNLYSQSQSSSSRLSGPVDAVSVTLAHNAAQQSLVSVPESKLNYGPLRSPIDAPCKTQVRDVPEEQLWALQGQIIELKPQARPQESEEEEVWEEETIESRGPAVQLSYSDLGYDSAKHKGCQFTVHRDEPTPHSCDEVHEIGNCGYQPGSLTIQQLPEEPHLEFDQGGLGIEDEPQLSWGIPSALKSSCGCGSSVSARLFGR